MMDRHEYTIDSGDVSLTGTVRKTLIQIITGTTRVAWLRHLKLTFASTTSTDHPVLVELREQSTAGTASSVTPIGNPFLPASIYTARNAFTVEPTDVGLVGDIPMRITPIGGVLVYDWDGEIIIPTSKRYAICLTSPDAQSNVRAGLKAWE